MCTVLQQHLNRQNGITNGESEGPATTNGYGTISVSPSPAGGRAESVALTPAPIGGVSSYWVIIHILLIICFHEICLPKDVRIYIVCDF